MDNNTKEALEKLRPIYERGIREQYSNEEYEELVLALGLSIHEWRQLQLSYSDYMSRGLGFLKYDALEDAIKELETALLIRPNDIDALEALSEAYFRLWEKKGAPQHARKSEKLARRCLSLNSEHELAMQRIARLQPKVEIRSTQQGTSIVVLLGAVAVALLVAGVLAFLVMGGQSVSTLPDAFPESEVITTASSDNGQLTIPIEFPTNSSERNLVFDAQLSELKIYDSKSSYYQFRGYVMAPDYELTHLVLEVDYLDKDGAVLASTKIFPMIPRPIVRPNDRIAVFSNHYDEKANFPLAKVQVKVLEHKSKMPSNKYPVLKPVNLRWTLKPSENLNIELKERASEINYNSFSKKNLHLLTLELSNTGKVAIKTIKAKIRWFDTKGHEIAADEVYFLTDHRSPVLHPGQMIPVYLPMSVGDKKEEIVTYEIELLSVEY